MRRLVALPIKTLAVTITILTGALYLAGEARQAVLRRNETDLARITGQAEAPARAMEAVAFSTAKPETGKTSTHSPALQAATPRPSGKHDSHRRQILVSIPDRKLALLEDGLLVKTYPIAVGARFSPSPDGDFVIINHAINPVYRHKGQQIQPGKDNPLGTRWIGLNLKGYGIHGTNVPSSIGKAASHGCFRMRKEDVEDLYTRVQVGDPVLIRKDRDALIAEVFPDEPKAATKAASVEVASAAGSEPGGAATTTGQ